ncbi:MAG: hypothetical protein KAX53_02335 [Saprospiraceae bacterium]|nr:hypothetical protein [Saprospiraceae bacterium]
MTPKEQYITQLKGKVFTSPLGKRYRLYYRKEGNRFFMLIELMSNKNYKMQIPEVDFNRTPIDQLLKSMEEGLLIE